MMIAFIAKTSDHTLAVELEAEDRGEVAPGVYLCHFTMHGHAIDSYYRADYASAKDEYELVKDRLAYDMATLAAHGLDPASLQLKE